MSAFEDVAADMERASMALPRVAARVAPKLLEVVRAQHSAGIAPDGSAWPPTKAGGVANLSLTAQVSAHAEGSSVVLDLPDLLLPSQVGHHVPLRPVVPAPGAALPDAWQRPIDDAVKAELGS